MARKTFISYKYSEAKDLRDKIIEKLGEDADYYQGETAESPDLTDTCVENIKKHLRNMIFNTSVIIVIISPNIKDSKWIDWEIEYSLTNIMRKDRFSRANGIIGVIMEVNGDYNWLITPNQNADGCLSRIIDSNKLYDIINNNRYNLNTVNKYSCPVCKTYSQLDGSYIALVEQDQFLADPNKYIENAYDKSQRIKDYDIIKQK